MYNLFTHYINTAAYITCYTHLELLLVDTLKHDYSHSGIKTSEDWDAALENIKHYTALLEKHNHPVDINDYNKGLGLSPALGLLLMHP